VNSYIENALKESKQKVLINNIYTYIKDPLPEGFDLDLVLDFVKKTVPEHLMYGLETIFIGQFEELEERDLDSVYKDGTIYVTNKQLDEDGMIEDIVHELAHLAEERFGEHVYTDRMVINEFLGKRNRLYEILKAEKYNVAIEDFYELEYNKKFDEFLYQEVGYDKLTFMTMGLFVSPYGATSLREYFADGFDFYFLKDPGYLSKISPNLFKKIENLVFKEYEG
jgi:hypothetical protein